jgi:hypothetical protein
MQRDLVRQQSSADRPLGFDEVDAPARQYHQPIGKASTALHSHLLAPPAERADAPDQ